MSNVYIEIGTGIHNNKLDNFKYKCIVCGYKTIDWITKPEAINEIKDHLEYAHNIRI
jgi:hypothetical protein